MRGDGDDELPARIIKALAALAIGGILLAFRKDVHEVWLRTALAGFAFLALAFALLQLHRNKS